MGEVPVGDDDPFGSTRRAGGVLEKGRGLSPRPGLTPARRQLGIHLVRHDPWQIPEGRKPRFAGSSVDGLFRQDHCRPAIAGDGGESGIMAPAPRRIGRDGHDSGIQATQESGDEIETGGIEEQCPLPRHAQALEPRRDGAGQPAELSEGQRA